MTKFELKELIKECYKEVIKEGKTHSQYPKPGLADPLSPEGPDNPMLSADQKAKMRLQQTLDAAETRRAWTQFKMDLINDPKYLNDLNALRAKHGDLPLDFSGEMPEELESIPEPSVEKPESQMTEPEDDEVDDIKTK